MVSFEQLLDILDRPGIDKEVSQDIIKVSPNLSLDDAYRLQIASKQRRVKEGDRIAGYQASVTSAAAQKALPGIPAPMVGTLMQSLIRHSDATVTLDADITFIEPEIGVLLGTDLSGPNVTPLDVLAATAGFVPAIEVAPVRAGVLEGKWSNQHVIAVQKAAGGFVVVGSKLTAPSDIDVRLEGAVVTIDGQTRASAAGVEAMGSPLNVVAAIANRLSAYGERLRAGMIVITGSLSTPQRVSQGVVDARVEFTRLGSVSVRFSR